MRGRILELKYFDEFENINKEYNDKIEIVNYKIDEYYENEIQMVKEHFNYDMIKIHNKRINFIQKLKNIMITDNIEYLENGKLDLIMFK